MKSWWMFMVTLCCITSLNAADLLKREPSEPMSVNCPTVISERVTSLRNADGTANAVIVAIDHGKLANVGVEEQLQKTLLTAYGLEFPVAGVAEAVASGKCLILPGEAKSNLALRRLSGVGMIAAEPGGAEVRVLPDFEEWHQGTIILAGRSAEEIDQAARQLIAAAPDAARIPRLLQLSPSQKITPPGDKDIAAMTEKLRQYFADSPDWLPQQHAFKQLQPLADGYRATGDDRFARAFAAMQKTYFDCYRQLPEKGRVAPTFVFHNFVWMVEVVSQSPEFTAEDRAFSAEMIRYMTEETMNFWEMADPIRVYNAGQQEYFTNHSIFAARSVWFAAHYLWTHYQYSPARYWMEVAANALAGIAPHPVGPEDSANYQHICYNIFMDFTINSGLYDLSFFTSPEFQEYIQYVVAQYHHNGVTYPNGDTHPLGNAGSMDTLFAGYDILQDKDCKALLTVIAQSGTPWHGKRVRALPGDWDAKPEFQNANTPLTIFYLDDFRLKRLKAPKASRNRIDKGYFRSGWTPDSDYLSISGVSGAPHGHYDTNAILLYSLGRYWYLVDGDYILKNPEEHNTLSLAFDGRHVRPEIGKRGALAEEVNHAQSASGKLAGLESAATAYGPVDWHRAILWRARRGFWVSDQLHFTKAGDYQADVRFRTLGKPIAASENRFGFRQKKDDSLPEVPNEFWIHNFSTRPGELSTQLDDGHGGGDKGYYSNYPWAEELTRVVTAGESGTAAKNTTVNLVNYCTHEPMEMIRVADNFFLATSANDWSAALFDRVHTDDIHFEGAWLLLSPEGILGAEIQSLNLFGQEIRPDTNGTVDLPLPAEFSQSWLTTKRQLPPIELKKETLTAPTLTVESVTLPSTINVIEAAPEGWYLGMDNGLVRACDRTGKTIREWSFPQAITALAALPDGGLAVGVAPRQAKGAGKLVVINANGDIAFEKELKPFHGRPGTIQTILPAKLAKDEPPAIVCGVSGWYFYAFSLTGKELWRKEIYHGALCSAAADFDGDGLDSIFVGAEYYYHQILAADGTVEYQKNTEPWNFSCAAVPTPSGKPVVLAGRSDDFVHWMTPNDTDRKDPINAGGIPIAIVPFGDHFAVLTANGNVLIGSVDGTVQKRRRLPNAATGMAPLGDSLFVRDRAGRIMQLDGDLNLLAVGEIPLDPTTIRHPGPVASLNSIAMAEANHLYLISR